MKYDLVSERHLRYSVKITNPADAYSVLKRYAKSKQEQFLLITLNGAHDIIGLAIISIGLVNRTIVHPREVFRPAIKDAATAVIVAHNHPSGHLEPSPEDIEITRHLIEVGELIGIPLLDHLVFSKTGFISLKERGLI
jgi:DNA repair protein RadC